MDALSQLFSALRVANAHYTRFETAAPWGHRVTHRGQIKFVFVVSGSCWLRTKAVAKPLALHANDLFLVLDGEPYSVSDSPGRGCIDCLDLEARRDGFLIRYGGHGAPATLISVALEIDAVEAESLLLALPRFIQLGVDQQRSHGLQSLLELLRLEISGADIGSLPIVRRVAEALFISAVRAHLQRAEAPRHGVLAAVTDAQLARPLGEMHDDPSRSWTVDGLARSARMSRSAFAFRFRATVGETPLEYLTRLRMDRARALIREGVAIADVAGRVGYDSSISFTRAFGRVVGQTPGTYRRERQASAAATDEAHLSTPARARLPAEAATR